MKSTSSNSLLRFYTIIFCYLICLQSLSGQEVKKTETLRMMFYNTENLFDTIDNPLTNDDEFTPEGENHWNSYRYFKKLNNLYKVIAACGSWQPPDIIGLCEVENRKVLKDLIYKTPLLKYDYEIIHYESPDKRGIDVALLYNKKTFSIIKSSSVPIKMENDSSFRTRDILMVQGFTSTKDTLTIFVNHWPSRRGGESSSAPKRIKAATVLRYQVDSILKTNPKSNIIIVGDFNDDPQDKSIYDFLKAGEVSSSLSPISLYNLSYNLPDKLDYGSIKYKGTWNFFDQVIVSGSLLVLENSIQYQPNSCTIFYSDLIVEPDESFTGSQPFKTYSGPVYKGGYSDHLPVVFSLVKK